MSLLVALITMFKHNNKLRFIERNEDVSFYAINNLDRYRLFSSLKDECLLLGFEERTKSGEYITPRDVSFHDLSVIFDNFKLMLESTEERSTIRTICITPHNIETRREYIRFLNSFSGVLKKEKEHRGILMCNDLLISSSVFKEGDAFQISPRYSINKQSEYEHNLRGIATLCF